MSGVVGFSGGVVELSGVVFEVCGADRVNDDFIVKYVLMVSDCYVIYEIYDVRYQ